MSKATTLRRAMNLWPPFLFSGIRVTEVSEDFRQVTVQLRQRWYNKNYVGTHFGGSMFAMADPFLMIMLTRILGREYTVWDKSASIDFIKPGTGTLSADFQITDAMLEEIRAATANEGDKFVPTYQVDLKNADGEVVGRVSKSMHIRKRKDTRSHIGN